MVKLNILKTANKALKPSKVAGTGWWKEPDRHSRAAKTGHAGGSYSDSGGSSSSKSSSAAKPAGHTHKASSDWSGNKFCEVCGKAL